MAPNIAAEESLDHLVRQLSPKSKRPSFVKRVSRSLVRFLIIFCIGVAATLAWESFGDEARKMIANSSPQLGWLAQSARNDTPSPDTMRQRLDQLAANQQQMAGDIAKLLTDQRQLLQKISAPLPPAASHANNMSSSSAR
jgi:predicted lysophospholipase L1 biosynthesis ABC-type transport system permease subunit